jgi:type IV pilus assembly protein PilN
MYGIDVNFLRDRNLEATSKTLTQTKVAQPTREQQQPMLIGLGVMGILLVIPLLSMLLLNWQATQTSKSIEELNAELEKLNADNKRVEEINQKLQATQTEIRTLVSVFDQVKPLSAILLEISSRIPESVQIKTIDHNAPKITIQGYASNYDVVNDFLLTLQNSKFLDAKQTKLISAKVADLPITVSNSSNLEANNITVAFPKGVEYTIETQLNQIPASQLLPDLARNGAVGLVTRLQTLEQKGAFQQ